MNKKRRNRNQTSQRIIEALEEVIAERGIEGIGINRIAEKAGVSKVLIYRYFGGLEGLVIHYVKMGRLFPVFSRAALEQLKPVQEDDLAKIWFKQAVLTYRFLREFPAGHQILRAPLIPDNSIAQIISKAQDEELTRLVDQISFVEGGDTRAISAVVLSAMSYLTILSAANQSVMGIELASEEGWQRIETAVKRIYTALNMALMTSETAHINTHKSDPVVNVLW
mgnify:CR=1 FL=1